jgi:hypothetical protein
VICWFFKICFLKCNLYRYIKGHPLQRATDPWGLDGDCHFVVDVDLQVGLALSTILLCVKTRFD